MIGYKATDQDGCCRGFKFEVGKTYTKDTKKEDLSCCTDKGFHFCRELSAIEKESNYKLSDSRLFEVIAGDFVRSGEKYCTNSLTILREITGDEKKELINSGNYNSGYCNSGDYNSGFFNSGFFNSGDYNSGNYNFGCRNSGGRNFGDYNSGYCNSGDYNSGCRNSGHHNSGHFNSGCYNSGFFNTDEPPLRLFGKETDIKRNQINIPSWLYFDLTTWVSHDTASEEEKAEHAEEIKTSGGFLKTLKYKEAFKLAYDKTDDNEKIQLFTLPNFNTKIFEEISGIDVTEDYKRLMKGEN